VTLQEVIFVSTNDREKHFSQTHSERKELAIAMTRVYFRPLTKGVVLPLAIVKRGRATP